MTTRHTTGLCLKTKSSYNRAFAGNEAVLGTTVSPRTMVPPSLWKSMCQQRGYIIYIYTHTHTRIADSLCCIAETNTTLHSNYMPMHIILNTKQKKKEKHQCLHQPVLSHLAPIPRAPLASRVVGAADGPLGMRWSPGSSHMDNVPGQHSWQSVPIFWIELS